MSPRSDPPGVPARRAALRLLDAVLRQGLPLEAALDAAAAGLAPADRGLAHAIAATVLRWLVDLDALIDGATARPLPDDAKARMALRIALAQALKLGTPGHAAIATVLPLVDGGPRRLVHGVFGTIGRAGATLPGVPTLPPAVALRWASAWGEEVVASAAAQSAAQPATDLTLRDPAETESLAAGIADSTSLAFGHLRVPATSRISELPGYADGRWWVQDLAASIPAKLAGRGPGTALDLCAAPGGKAMQLAAAGWQVTGIELSERRQLRMAENLKRTGLSASLITADVESWQPAEPADLVLLDAPCSATGIFRRHPDVLHRVRPSAIRDLAAAQARMLARAAGWVRPGGVLIYAVCSLEPQEGEAVARAFLTDTESFGLVPPASGELPAGIIPTDEGFVRVTPAALAATGGADGFFVARFRRHG